MSNVLELHIFVHGQDQSGVMQQLASIQKTLGEIQMTEQEFLAALQQVDATTTKIGTNLDAVAAAQAGEASVVQAISDEMDKLIAGGSSNGLSPAAQASFQALADKLQLSSDNSDKITAAIQAQVPVLTAIAAKGTAAVPPAPPAPPLPLPI